MPILLNCGYGLSHVKKNETIMCSEAPALLLREALNSLVSVPSVLSASYLFSVINKYHTL